MLTELETQLLEVPDLLQCLLRVAQDEARLSSQSPEHVNDGTPCTMHQCCGLFFCNETRVQTAVHRITLLIGPGTFRQSSLISETTPSDILLHSGLVMPPSSAIQDTVPKRRKGQHKRTWHRNGLKAMYNTMKVPQATTPAGLDLHASLCLQVDELQRRLCERDLELMLLRDTLSMLLARKAAGLPVHSSPSM